MSAGGVALVVLTAEGRAPPVLTVVAAGRSGDAILTELLPRENPIPKKTAQSATSPKNRASILPVPSVISVSSSSRCHFYLVVVFDGGCSALRSGSARLHRVLRITSECSEKKSTGTGKTTVVFFSTPISVKVCR